MKIKPKIFFVILLLFFDFFSLLAENKYNVLHINSSHPGFKWAYGYTIGISSVFDEHDSIEVYTEYLDAIRFPDKLFLKDFYNYISKKYNKVHFDAIIGTDDDAASFLQVYADSLARLKPVILSGINSPEVYDFGKSKCYIIEEKYNFLAHFKLLKKIQPGLKKIYILGDFTTTSLSLQEDIKASLEIGTTGIEMAVVRELRPEFIAEGLSMLDPASQAVLYIGVYSNNSGVPISGEKFIKEISSKCSAPIYTGFPELAEVGATLTIENSSQNYGKYAAEITIKILKDKSYKPNLANIIGGNYIANYNRCKLYNIRMDLLPPGTTFVQKPKSFFTVYWRHIIVVLVFILLLLATILVLILNISKRKRTEFSLKETEKRFRDLVALLPQNVFECDIMGKFTFVNDFGLQMFQYSKGDLERGLSLFQLFRGNEEMGLLELFKENRPQKVKASEMLAQKKDGSNFPVLLYTSPIIPEDEMTGIRGIIVDFSKYNQIRDELIAAKEKAEEGDKLKSAFLANLSHEIRTPLNGILGFSELLQEPFLSDAQRKDCIAHIQDGCDSLLNLIEDLINFSKIETGQIELDIQVLDVNKHLKRIFADFNEKRILNQKGHINLRLAIPNKAETVWLKADLYWFKQVFYNLIDNAFKYTEFGFIEFGYKTLDDGSFLFYTKDSGIGIAKENLEIIFNRFTKIENRNFKFQKGSGIGLAITKNILKLLKGEIWVESTPGLGSTFYFTLPFFQSK